jgi:putative intracellular protease/amidase
MGDSGGSTGLWLSEMTHPFDVMQKAGFQVDIASIKGGKVPLDPRSTGEDDPINNAFLADPSTAATLEQSATLADANPSTYDAIVFAGGHGTVWDFPTAPAVDRVASAIYAQGGIVAAICHGPAALLNIHDADGALLIKGKAVAGFSNAEEHAVGLEAVVPFLLEDRLKEGGALYSEAPLFTPHTVVDGRLITGQNPQSAVGVGEAVIKALRQS